MFQKDYLWLNLKDLPYFRALVRSIEARFVGDIDLFAPTLDLGCGDGHFASVAYNRRIEVGVDPSIKSLREASKRNVYQIILQSEGAYLPFPDAFFSSVVSNSVFEHIPNLDIVMHEVARVTKPGGKLVFCVPNQLFLSSLSISRFFEKIHLSSFSKSYQKFFNRISRHYHCDDRVIWEARLKSTGFKLESSWNYFAPVALACMEWGHFFGLPSLLIRWITGRWILVPCKWNLAMTQRVVTRHYMAEPRNELGVYSFYIAIKI